ncbi:MAG: bifunctional folylpolyglutamate synthase/dihydrofolate synthase [Acidobacteriaceae bacterium]|nr:bifunctional folylpolyglutamate synthase/dihydrofolate synthase [Acidobacteriaceae bacterium]
MDVYAQSQGSGMTYADAVRTLYSLGNEVQTAKLGLERVSRLLVALGSPHLELRVVHVAGTNGKGSTSAMIESGLRAAGYRTGLYTSPHLEEPTERISILGSAVSRDDFARAFELVHSTAQALLRSGELDLHPTYFECVTAMAFVVFREARLDWVVLEVGLGGRLDATNVVHPKLCVITAIDLDHQSYLGDTLAKIAAEKAGILKAGVPAVFSPQPEEAGRVLASAAKGTVTWAGNVAIQNVRVDARGSRFEVDGMEVRCPLPGRHQIDNARTAALALKQLGVSVDGIASVRWPGRLERVGEHPDMILDGAHNPSGARALAAYIREFYSGRRIWLVYGVMGDKDVGEMTALLFPLAQRLVLTRPENARAMPPERIPAQNATITHSIPEALQAAHEAEPNDAVFITGSLYVVGEARSLLVR